jgi:hypothetical protein
MIRFPFLDDTAPGEHAAPRALRANAVKPSSRAVA